MKQVKLKAALWLVVAAAGAWGSFAHGAEAEPPAEGEHFPHAFLIPMGIPGAAGSYSVQITPFLQRSGGSSKGDVGGHASLGLFDWGGLHFRSLGARTARTTEIIGMVGLWRDAERQRGLSVLGILGLPTGPKEKQDHSGLSYLVGVTWRLRPVRWLRWDANLHYDFTAHHFVPESGLVARVAGPVYATLDARATLGEGTRVTVLPALKYRLLARAFLGLGYEFPLTDNRADDGRFYVQLEVGWH